MNASGSTRSLSVSLLVTTTSRKTQEILTVAWQSLLAIVCKCVHALAMATIQV